MLENILEIIGHTPLVHLSRYFLGDRVGVFAKLESGKPDGSITDRSVMSKIKYAFGTHLISPGNTVIESSSCTMGIGLAQLFVHYAFRFICVIDSKTTLQNSAMLSALGAEVDSFSEPDPVTGELVSSRRRRVAELIRTLHQSGYEGRHPHVSKLDGVIGCDASLHVQLFQLMDRQEAF